MKILSRKIQKNVEKSLFRGKVVVIYGARQVGKTTLVKEIQKNIRPTVFISTVMNRISELRLSIKLPRK